MKTKSNSRSAFFNLRVLTACAFSLFAIAVVLLAQERNSQQTQQTNRSISAQDVPGTQAPSVIGMSGPAPCSWAAGPSMPTVGTRMVGVFFPGTGKLYAMGGRSSDT